MLVKENPNRKKKKRKSVSSENEKGVVFFVVPDSGISDFKNSTNHSMKYESKNIAQLGREMR